MKKNKLTLQDFYKSLSDAGVFDNIEHTDTFKQLLAANSEYVLSEFEIAFAEFLPMLHHEGITYEAGFNDHVHLYKGSFILFKRQHKLCRMDLQNRYSYRYDHHFFGEDTRCNYGQLETRLLIGYLNDRLYEKI